MAITDTSLSDYSNDPYHGGNFFVTWREAGDASMYAGVVVEEADSHEEVKIGATGSTDWFGFMALMPDIDTDSTIDADGDPIRIYLPGQGTILWLRHDGNADQTYAAGKYAEKSTNTAGCVELWGFTDADNIAQNTMATVVGKSFYDETEGTSTGTNQNWNRFIT